MLIFKKKKHYISDEPEWLQGEEMNPYVALGNEALPEENAKLTPSAVSRVTESIVNRPAQLPGQFRLFLQKLGVGKSPKAGFAG